MDLQNARSLQEIIRRRRQFDFVGRARYLDSFRENLTVPVDDERRRFIYYISGPAGVGKTWLLKRFDALAQQFGAATAWTDDSDGGVSGVMEQILQRFAAQECSPAFREYLSTAWQSPDTVSVGRVAGNRNSGDTLAVGRSTSSRDEASATVLPAEGRRDGNAAELTGPSWVGLPVDDGTLQGIQDLTRLFVKALQLLARTRPIALFFDTYERTSHHLDGWLRAIVEGHYGELPASTIIGIAGQNALDAARWGSLETVIARIDLEPFSDEEARLYLARRGLVQDRTVRRFIEASKRLPVLLATAALIGPDEAERVTETSDDAIGYFLRSIDEAKVTALLSVAFPRRLNADLLEVIVGSQEAGLVIGWLRALPFVEQRGDAWILRECVRNSLLEHAHRVFAHRWSRRHAELAEFYDRLGAGLGLALSERWRSPIWQAYALETIYHRLCQSPTESLPLALSGFISAFGEPAAFVREWARTVQQAGGDFGSAELRDWGDALLHGLDAYAACDYASTADLFARISRVADLDGPARIGALSWQSRLLSVSGQVTRSLEVYAELVRSAPQVADHWLEKATSLARLGYHQKAVEDFDRALEIDPRNVRALVNRGEACRLLEAYDDALESFNRALELGREDARILGHRGQVYVALERYSEGLADLNRALELAPNETWVLAERANALRGLGRYEDAIADLNRVLRLDPGNVWALAVRGDIYWQTKRYETARVDFHRALDIQPRPA